ncbi:MAG: hypothetical protein AAF236_11630 [Verrucomicrobiota bacterium]
MPARLKHCFGVAGLANVLLLLTACSVPGIRLQDHADLGTPELNAFALPQRSTPETREFLREEGFVRLAKTRDQVIEVARKHFDEEPSAKSAVVLSELLCDRAGKLTGSDPIRAIGLYLSAAEMSLRFALSEDNDRLRRIYNFSCGRVAMLIYESQLDLSRDLTIEGPQKDWTLKAYRQRPGLIQQYAADVAWATDTLKLKGFDDIEREVQEGFGASMVGHRFGTSERKESSPFLASVGMSLPASVILDFPDQNGSVELAVYDALLVDRAKVGGVSVPLNIDFTAPLATLASHIPDHQAGIKGMLNPDRESIESGLFEVEPHRPDQIPVVFVHGLMSSPGTWTHALNTIRADERLRANYQFLVFFYPTGYPIPHNAALLRQALKHYQQFYDPDRSNPRLREMVMIGHSMGGILTNMQIRESGRSLERQVLTRPIAEIDGFTAEQRKMLSEATLYTANQDIARAIFVASPHRGCELAEGWIGNLGGSLIHFRSPFDSLRMTPLEEVSEITSLGAEMLRKPPTSIQELKSNSMVLTTVLNQPLRQGIELHSIIGNHKGSEPLSESSDRVVPYWSSHLEGVASEKVVEADHVSITKDSEAIAEIRRILYQHAGIEEGD